MKLSKTNDQPDRRANDAAVLSRLDVIETRLNHIDKLMDGRKEVGLQLINEISAHSVEMESLRGRIESLKDDLLLAIEKHMNADQEKRTKQVRAAFWTLLTISLTSAITLLMQSLTAH